MASDVDDLPVGDWGDCDLAAETGVNQTPFRLPCRRKTRVVGKGGHGGGLNVAVLAYRCCQDGVAHPLIGVSREKGRARGQQPDPARKPHSCRGIHYWENIPDQPRYEFAVPPGR